MSSRLLDFFAFALKVLSPALTKREHNDDAGRPLLRGIKSLDTHKIEDLGVLLVGQLQGCLREWREVSSSPRRILHAVFFAAASVFFLAATPSAYGKITPTLTVATSGTPSTYGTSVTFTATISSGPTGTITFYDGTTSIGTGTISGTHATYTTSVLVAGSHSITAKYPGNSSYNAVTSSAITQVVNKVNPTLTVATSGTPSAFGGSVTFTGTISSGPTGTMTFYDSGTSIGTGTISGTTATYTTNNLTAGTHSITASWAGNTNYNSVTSSAITQTVNNATPPGPGIITTIAGDGVWNNSGDGGLAINAEIKFPERIAIDTAGNIYIPDWATGVVRKVSASNGVITTIAGTGSEGYSNDGHAATTAQLNDPMSIALDAAGNVYIADYGNNRIRKVTVSTGIITTIAGTGTAGSSGDGGPATSAQLSQPGGIAFDQAGNLYIADSGNSLIRKVSVSTGIITTVAGTRSTITYSGDGGPATSAGLYNPISIALDSSENFYIVDTGHNVVRKVTVSTGIISTIAGNGVAGYTGDGGSGTNAELNNPAAVVVDAANNIFIADDLNSVIRFVSATTGAITTAVGNGTQGYSGDGGPARSAELNRPSGLAFDSLGNLYIGDCANSRVRVVGDASRAQISLSVSPVSAMLYTGQTQQFAATVINTSNTAVLWSISPAGVGTINSSGLYTAPATISNQQTVIVTATSQANTTKSASATITLSSPITVSVSPVSATLAASQQQSFTATVTNTSNTSVVWSISPTGIGTLSSSGLYTAPANIATQQTLTITATSQADTTKSASATVLLVPPCNWNGYGYVRSIVIDHAKVPNSDQANFPFLFSVTDPALRTTANGGHVTNGNGYDIVFTSDSAGQSRLDSEIEEYNPLTGQLVAWVRIPTLSHSADTMVYLFYGNSSVTTSQQNPTGVWDANYVGIWHFPNGTTLSASDSTANGSNGTVGTGASAAAGIVDGAASVNGSGGGYVSFPTSSAVWNFAGDMTLSAWVKTTSNGALVIDIQNSNPLAYISVGPTTVGGAANRAVAYFRTNNGGVLVASGSTQVNDGQWHNIQTVRSTGSAVLIYVDGVLQTTTPYSDSGPIGISGGGASIGGGGSNYALTGLIDEARISKAARSADWIATEYNNERSPSTFSVLGAESSVVVSPGSSALFANQSQQFSAINLSTGTCGNGVTWSIPSNAPGNLSATGLYSAPSTIEAEQSIQVTATSTTNPLIAGTALVTILPAQNPRLALSAPVQPPYVVGTSQQFTATLTNGLGSPMSGIAVNFVVTGTNATSGTVMTDSTGKATFTYAGANIGTDSISAAVQIGATQVHSNQVSASWLAPVQPISSTSLTGEFFFSNGSCTFNTPANAAPAFVQTFPSINFNPVNVSIPGLPIGNWDIRPFTDVTTDINGNFVGTIIAQGNGYQAGVTTSTYSMDAFQAVFRGAFTVENPGNVVFNFFSDDGFIFGVGNGATRVSGPTLNMPGTTPFAQYPAMGAFNGPAAGVGNQIVVNFPAAGTYPYEVDYTECDSGGLTLQMGLGASSPTGVPPTGSLGLTPNSFSALPIGSQTGDLTVVATDVSGAAVPNLPVSLIVSGANDLTRTKTTNSAGQATFSYRDVNEGTDFVQVVATIDGMVAYSNVVTIPWTSGPVTPTINNSGDGSTLSISVSAQNTVILPSTLPVTATVSDSALQSGGTISVAWSQVSGSGTATFANSNSLSTTASFSEPGGYVLKLSASDPDASDSVSFPITVNPAPDVPQGWIGSPLNGSTVSGIVPITVASGETLQSGTLTFSPANNATNVTTVLNANTTGSGQIGKLDTTTLANGLYWITLQATDTNGDTSYNLALVTVVGNYKPGRVTSTVTDLVVPAKGLAIQIQRTYDSLNAGTSSDFGYGWNLGTNVNLSVNPMGSVTFTLGGQRRTFYLTPQYGGFLPFYVPAFTPEPGLHGTLISAGSGCSDFFNYVVPDGSLWACVGGGFWTPPGYVYTDPAGTAYTMTASGQLQSIVDKNGNTLTVSPNGITSSTGLQVTFQRDSQGRITSITDSQQPPANVYQYSYDSRGNLASVTYPSIATSSTYTYDSNHFYLSGTDFRGYSLPTTVYYDSSTDGGNSALDGRLSSVTDALGEKTSYAYDLSTNTTTISYPDGGTATMVYDTMGKVLSSTVFPTPTQGLTTRNTYDADQNLLTTTDPLGNITCYAYDSNGNRRSTSLPQPGPNCSSIVTTTTYNQYSEPMQTVDEDGNLRYFNYDVNFNPQSVTDNLGTLASFVFNNDGTMQSGAIGFDISVSPSKASQFTYDADGNMICRTDALGRSTSYSYDSLGHKTSMTVPQTGVGCLAAGTTNAGTTTYQYDAFGNLTETDAPLGRTTKSTYDGNGNKKTDTDALQNITNYTYDALNRLNITTYPTSPVTTSSTTYDFRGNVITETDQAGHVTKHTYDLAGRQISVTQAYGTSNATTTTYSYYDDGRKHTESDAQGHTTTYSYDTAGNLTGVSGPGGTFSYGYDNARNRVSMTQPGPTGSGSPSVTTMYEYDARKRLVETDYPDTTKKTNSYDGAGNLISVTDQNSHTVEYAYDAANQLQSVTQDNSPNAPNNVTSYGYNLLGDITGLTDAKSRLTENVFDLLSEKRSTTLPDGSLIEQRTYDAAGNLQTLQHFNGKTTTYAYYPLNRLQSRTPDPTTGETAVGFTYTATGKRYTMTDASGTTTYGYDDMDRLITKATPEGTLNYTYDSAGHLASMTSSHTNGVSVSYTYDSLNRLSTVVDGRLSGNQTTTYTYDAANNVATVTYPNTVQTVFSYDPLNRATQLATSQTGYLYTFDAAGNRKTASEYNGRSVSWNFDGIDRLASETITGAPGNKNGTASYVSDPVGNRTSATSSIPGLTPTGGTFNADDQLSGESYDPDGNVTASGGKTFTYDTENHLTSMNGGSVTILYDGDGNRVAKTVSGVTTRYLVDDLNSTGYPQVVEEVVNGAVQRQYTNGLQRISENQLVSNTWTPSFYGYDGFGTVRQLTNSSGTITDTYDYDAFGNKVNSTGTTPNAYMYRGEAYDSDLGLYYLRARWMNPLTGRFMSQDPQQHDPITPLLPFTYHSLRVARKPLDPIRWHRYLYANADPVNMIDPSGRDAAETAGADADSIELTGKTVEEIKETSFVDKFNDVDAAMDQLESLEDDLSYCDEGYCASSKKSLDALINIAKTLKFLP